MVRVRLVLVAFCAAWLMFPNASLAGARTRADLRDLGDGTCTLADAWLDTDNYAWNKPYLTVGEREWKIAGRGGREALARVVYGCMPDSTGFLKPSMFGSALREWLTERHKRLSSWVILSNADLEACGRQVNTVSTSEIPTVVAACERLEAQAQDVARADEGVAFEKTSRTIDLVRWAVHEGSSGVSAATAEVGRRAKAVAEFRSREASLLGECTQAPRTLGDLDARRARCTELEQLIAQPPQDATVAPETRTQLAAARAEEPVIEAALRQAIADAAATALSTCTTTRPADRSSLTDTSAACDRAEAAVTSEALPPTALSSIKTARDRLAASEKQITAKEAAERAAAQKAFEAKARVAEQLAWEAAIRGLAYPSMASLLRAELVGDDGKDSFMYMFDAMAPNAYGAMRRTSLFAGITVVSAKAETYKICRKSGIAAAGIRPDGWYKRELREMLDWCP